MAIRVYNNQNNSHYMTQKMANQRTYSKYAQQAAVLMGEQIKLGRKRLRWSEKELAERAGISRATLQKIEKGEMGCAVGLVFEVSTLVGLKLFDSDAMSLASQLEQTRDKISLLPQRIKEHRKPLRDDF